MLFSTAHSFSLSYAIHSLFEESSAYSQSVRPSHNIQHALNQNYLGVNPVIKPSSHQGTLLHIVPQVGNPYPSLAVRLRWTQSTPSPILNLLGLALGGGEHSIAGQKELWFNVSHPQPYSARSRSMRSLGVNNDHVWYFRCRPTLRKFTNSIPGLTSRGAYGGLSWRTTFR
jgi:hypothetical protein